MEADLQETYGVALAGLFTGALSWRRLGVLVRQLPATSRTARLLTGTGPFWGVTDHLLAAVFDALNIANWQRVAATTKHPPRAPKPITRPGDKPVGRIGRTDRSPEQVKAWLATFNPPAPEPEEVHGGG